MNYKQLNLKAGIEIHQQLNTHKLFCNCSSEMKEDFEDKIERKQHPVMSELGEVDRAAKYEYLKDRKFFYKTYPTESCLVECDEEPPFPVNKEALRIGLEIALLLECDIPDEIHIMRKTVIDGSNTSGFQRTMTIGLNGKIKGPRGREIKITHVALEEDACAIERKTVNTATYKLNRLAVPLVEISTETLEGFDPKEIQEIAAKIGMILRSTGKIKRGIGTIRQDINVSIKNGPRVEIKGIQELRLISKIIENEVKRQLKTKVKEETRMANPDETTSYMRPLPGAARMYPETDLEPVKIDNLFLRKIKKQLPEILEHKKQRFEKMKLSEELAKEIAGSNYSYLFEKIVSRYKVEPKTVANVFVNTLRDLERREKIDIKKLDDDDFMKLFYLLENKKIVKESIPEILKYVVQKSMKVDDVVKKFGFETLSENELKKIVKDVIDKNKGKPQGAIVGIVMSKVRGKASAKDVIELVEENI